MAIVDVTLLVLMSTTSDSYDRKLVTTSECYSSLSNTTLTAESDIDNIQCRHLALYVIRSARGVLITTTIIIIYKLSCRVKNGYVSIVVAEEVLVVVCDRCS